MPWRYREHPYIPARDPLGAIPPSRHPFQVWVMAALVISGLANFLTEGTDSLQNGLPPTYQKIWGLTLAIAALTVLVSAWWPDRVTGLLLERAGLWTLGLSCPIFALVVYLDAGLESRVVGIVLTALIGIACIWRAIHTNRELKIVRRFMIRYF